MNYFDKVVNYPNVLQLMIGSKLKLGIRVKALMRHLTVHPTFGQREGSEDIEL